MQGVKNWYHYPNFIDGKIVVKSSLVTYPRSHSQFCTLPEGHKSLPAPVYFLLIF